MANQEKGPIPGRQLVQKPTESAGKPVKTAYSRQGDDRPAGKILPGLEGLFRVAPAPEKRKRKRKVVTGPVQVVTGPVQVVTGPVQVVTRKPQEGQGIWEAVGLVALGAVVYFVLSNQSPAPAASDAASEPAAAPSVPTGLGEGGTVFVDPPASVSDDTPRLVSSQFDQQLRTEVRLVTRDQLTQMIKQQPKLDFSSTIAHDPKIKVAAKAEMVTVKPEVHTINPEVESAAWKDVLAAPYEGPSDTYSKSLKVVTGIDEKETEAVARLLCDQMKNRVRPDEAIVALRLGGVAMDLATSLDPQTHEELDYIISVNTRLLAKIWEEARQSAQNSEEASPQDEAFSQPAEIPVNNLTELTQAVEAEKARPQKVAVIPGLKVGVGVSLIGPSEFVKALGREYGLFRQMALGLYGTVEASEFKVVQVTGIGDQLPKFLPKGIKYVKFEVVQGKGLPNIFLWSVLVTNVQVGDVIKINPLADDIINASLQKK